MTRLHNIMIWGLTLLAASFGTAEGVIVSGQVTDENGVGIPLVDLDFFDRDQGLLILTPGDDTDFLGFYSVDVPLAEYDITYNAPAGSPYLDVEVRTLITGVVTIDVTLPFGHAVSGLVTDAVGTGLFNVDLDFYDKASGDVINTNDDNTNILGQFNVLVPAATYDIRFTPQLGDPYAGQVISDVVITAGTNLGTFVLDAGLFVSGQVVDGALAPILDLDLDFEDEATGTVIFSPRDNSDAGGLFNTPVPTAVYRVIFNPPLGSGLAYKAIPLTVIADTALGQIQMDPGFTLSGVVQQSGAVPVVNADLDMVNAATRDEIPTDFDNTDGTGSFAMTAPATTMDIVVKPPLGAPLAAHVSRNVVVAGNLDVGTIVLMPGFVISGNVQDLLSNPVAGADLDLVEIGSGLPYPTIGDDTDVAGNYSVRALGGAYMVIMTPPIGSYLDPDTVIVNPLAANTVINFTLGSGFVGVGDGVPLTPSGSFFASPNPFNPVTTIRFQQARQGRVELTVFAPSGRRIRSLLDEELPAGPGEVVWDGLDDRGNAVASGRYIAVRQTADGTERTSVVLVR